MDKATRVLILYHQLLSGQMIDKVTYSLEHGINERTFDRDIETIRLFLKDIYSGDQVLFIQENNTYYLSGKRPKYIGSNATRNYLCDSGGNSHWYDCQYCLCKY